LRLAFSHGGGTFPFFLPRFEHGWSGNWNNEPPEEGKGGPLRQQLPRSPMEYARMLYYDTLLFDGRAIQYLKEIVGTSQIVVGTDFPFVPREKPVGKTLFSMGLSEEELEAVTWRNCLRFLGVENQ
jgi:aminocarboxymuconate-semialdehyde decarboxylase